MSDISLTEANILLKNKNSDDECTANKKMRLDTFEEADEDVKPTSSSHASSDPSHASKPTNTEAAYLLTTTSSMLSPKSEPAASTSASTPSEWTSLFRDHRIPVPYNDFQNPRQLLSHLIPSIDVHKLPSNLDDFDICRLIYQLMASSESSGEAPSTGLPILSDMFLMQREKLIEYNTIEQCVELIERSESIIVLTGAGCSVSCGIPDFRSRDGVYARLRVDFPDLPDPQAMFDIFYFEHDPRPFFKFAKEIYPGQFKPSLSHMFIKKLEDNQKLLRNYTQNIDTLEMTAQIKKVIQCHGSFATATCTSCKLQVDADFIREKIFNQEIPYCDKCKTSEASEGDEAKVNEPHSEAQAEQVNCKKNNSAGVLKPDIVFFGENLPELYHKSIGEDKSKCDLLIVIGSSLKVKPVANIPHLLPQKVPQILINRESLKHLNFDIELLGDCDVIVNEILLRLEQKRLDVSSGKSPNWSDICQSKMLLQEISNEKAEELLFNNQNAANDQSDSSNSSIDNSTLIVENQNKFAENNKDKETLNDESSSKDMQYKSDDPNLKKYTKDYLNENSFLHLKPNMYVFHGAEIQLKQARKKLKRFKKMQQVAPKSSGDSELSDNSDDSDDSDDLTDDSEDDTDSDDEDESQGDEVECEAKNENENKLDGNKESKKTNELVDLLTANDDELDDEDEDEDEDFTPELDLSKKSNLVDYLSCSALQNANEINSDKN